MEDADISDFAWSADGKRVAVARVFTSSAVVMFRGTKPRDFTRDPALIDVRGDQFESKCDKRNRSSGQERCPETDRDGAPALERSDALLINKQDGLTRRHLEAARLRIVSLCDQSAGIILGDGIRLTRVR